jgi:predicted O-linked N-acetylglucosamine transferase (SPINDLY family)
MKHSEKNPGQHQIDELVALFNQGQYQKAADSARVMTTQYPSNSFGWGTLGAVLQQMGRNADALQPMQKAVALSPNDAQAHNNLGNTLSYLGKPGEAEASFRRALKIDKNFAEAHLNLGATLHDMGRFDEAEVRYRRVIQIKPDLADAHYNLGNTLKNLGRFAEATTCYRKALQLKPNLLGAYSNLGIVLQETGNLTEAETVLRRAIQLKPDYIEAYSNLGSTLNDMGRLDEARVEYETALRIKPDHAEILNNLGNTLLNMGRHDEAIGCYRRALQTNPGYLKARSNLIFSLNYSTNHTQEFCFAEALEYGRIVRSKVSSAYTQWSSKIQPERLRVGLVSADFGNHPVGYFMESVLSQLSTTSIELIAYPTSPKSDEMTARIKPRFSAWKPLYGKSDEAAARLIHDDGVHILIDLSGHTKFNRLPIFSWKPAPVQVAWLGYFATTGVAEIDFIIGDPYVTPDSEAGHFTEKIWQLPECYWCFSAPAVQIEVSALPALSAGHITFGCFNNLTKMNDAVVAVWARILYAVPGSRLFLKYSQLNDPLMRKTTLERYAKHGIGAERLILEGRSSRAEYLACYHRVDIALDPFPYPGGTTSLEGLWMGVPFITKRGNRFLSHAGETIACNARLREWVAADEDDYIAKAVSFAAEPARLAELRAGLRQQVLASPVFDAARFAGNFEKAMWDMWEQKKASLLTQSK